MCTGDHLYFSASQMERKRLYRLGKKKDVEYLRSLLENEINDEMAANSDKGGANGSKALEVRVSIKECSFVSFGGNGLWCMYHVVKTFYVKNM